MPGAKTQRRLFRRCDLASTGPTTVEGRRRSTRLQRRTSTASRRSGGKIGRARRCRRYGRCGCRGARIRLHRAKHMTANLPEGPVPAIGNPRSLPLLYVDDQPENLELFQLQFGQEFVVHTAPSATAALDRLAREDFALLLTDERMPVLSGIDLLSRVVDRWPDVVRVIVSAYGDAQRLLSAINRGHAHEYVLKPWNRDELAACLDRGLTIAARRRALAARAEVSQVLERDAREAVACRRRDRRRRRARAGDVAGAAGGAHRCDGPDHGRDRHRQGSGGALHSRDQPAQRRALHPRELRGAGRGTPRERALRPRGRGVHRRATDAARALRAGAGRDDLSRRDR